MRVLLLLLALLAGCGGDRLARDPALVAPPWEPGRTSIYASPVEGESEPYEEGEPDPEVAERTVGLLRAAVADMTAAHLGALYQQLTTEDVPSAIELVLDGVGAMAFVDQKKVDRLAEWLAEHAPDRAPVKVAMALMMLHGEEHRELLLHLGRHEDLTHFAAIGLSATSERERNMFELARSVHGWGRIDAIELLGPVGDPEIRDWLLREGYRNDIAYGYLAYTCADAGGLRDALMKESVDDELLRSAGEIIEALLIGEPFKGMDTYYDGAPVVDLYLRHLGPEPTDLEQLVVVGKILAYLDAHPGWSALARPLAETIVKQPYWKELIAVGLADPDPATFDRAAEAATIVGVPTWDAFFARLERGEDRWWAVLQTDNAEHIDRVIALAEKRMPLPEATLKVIREELKRFPGKGQSLISPSSSP